MGGTPAAKWNPKHPALRRMNWKGKNGGDPNACKIAFLNSGSSPSDAVWLSPDGSEAVLGIIEPGQTFKLDTFKDHKFKLRKTGQSSIESSPIGCKRKKGRWVLAEDFSVKWAGGKGEEL